MDDKDALIFRLFSALAYAREKGGFELSDRYFIDGELYSASSEMVRLGVIQVDLDALNSIGNERAEYMSLQLLDSLNGWEEWKEER
jgi:hypothetical protein